MKKNTLFITALIALVASCAFAQSIHYEPEDSSPALRIYNGGTESVTFNLYAGDNATNSIVIGSQTNTLDFSGAGADTISEIAEDIAACTNSSSGYVLRVDSDCSVSTDSTDDELLGSQTVTIAAGQWGEIVWDTSVAKFYSVYMPSQADGGASGGAYKITNIYGTVGGTGALTLEVYVDGTLVWNDLHSSSSGVVTTVPIDVSIPVSGAKGVMIRATRATTATTGLIGAVVE